MINKERILKKLINKLTNNSIGLINGNPKILFEKEHKLYSILEFNFNLIESEIQTNTFCSGLSGFGWYLETLLGNNKITANTNEILKDIDTEISNWMLSEIKNENYDYLHGAIGAGLYFLKRAKSNPDVRISIDKLLEILYSQSILVKNGQFAWLQKLNNEYKTDYIYNLGISHGIPSILIFLVKCYEQNINSEELQYYINGTVQYLLSVKQDFKKYGFYFPYSIKLDGSFEPKSRLAWCYGDLGVCISLWHANKILKDINLENTLKEILITNATKRDLVECGVIDAMFCHGSVGIAHIFKRFYERYNIIELKAASDYWYQVTLELAVHEDGLGGYKAWKTAEYGGWQNEYSLLEGIAGIAASFHYAITNEDPFWDEAFLIS